MTGQAVLNKNGKVVKEAAIQEFKAKLRGEVVCPEDGEYEAVRKVLERDDRQTARLDRSVHRRSRRYQFGQVCP